MTQANTMNSLDLIEDCLKQIYWARKSSLIARAKRFKEKHEQSAESSSSIVDEIEQPNEAVGKVATASSYEISSESDFHLNQPSLKISAINKSQYVRKKITDKVLSSKSDDLVAQSLYIDFLFEISKWLKTNEQGLRDENVRGEFADYLVDKYLSKKLDIFERSEMVADIRKQVSNDIENFASEAIIPERNPKLCNNKSPGNGDPSTGEANDDNIVTTSSEELNNSIKPSINSSAKEEEKVKKQKDKIKAQYDSFTSTRKKVTMHPDAKIVQEYSDLNNDIQSLISSLQNGKILT